jgi:hypothetical protein
MFQVVELKCDPNAPTIARQRVVKKIKSKVQASNLADRLNERAGKATGDMIVSYVVKPS